MRVWVLMGNDYPDAVYADQATADAEVVRRMSAQRAGMPKWETPRIYWRVYDFELVMQVWSGEPAPAQHITDAPRSAEAIHD